MNETNKQKTLEKINELEIMKQVALHAKTNYSLLEVALDETTSESNQEQFSIKRIKLLIDYMENYILLRSYHTGVGESL